MLFFTILSNAQDYTKILGSQIVRKTNGVITLTNTKNDMFATKVSLPEYYDRDLSILTVNDIIKKYSDITIIEEWTQEEVNSYKLTFIVGNNHLVVIYIEININSILIIQAKLK